jgi:hypothetical protein
VDADVAAHDDRLAVEAVLEPAQDVAHALPVLAPDDLERDPPADAFPEPALDLGGARADDEERRPPPRGDEGLERALEERDARERQEGGNDARRERAERGAVAVGEEDGRHLETIMAGRRPERERQAPKPRTASPVVRPARALTSGVASRA